MSNFVFSRRRPSSALRTPRFTATSVSVLALTAICAHAQAQQPTQLPPVPVTPPAAPAQKAAQPKAAPKQAAPVAKAQPKQAPAATQQQQAPAVQPAAATTVVPVAPEQAIRTLPAASAEAAAAKLEVKNATGSALNLTPRETPATVNIVSQQDIEERGARGLVETLKTIPGVVVGNNPGEVGTGVTRGFYKATSFSVDGSRVVDPVFLGRDYSSYHIDRVEVLKGPASVVSGISGLAGSYNIITKQATTERTFAEGMVSYGSFQTLETGVGVNLALSPWAAVRSTATFSNSNGYVDDTDFTKYGFTNSILLKPTDRLKITAAIDYFKDDYSTAYYATPLIDRSVARDPTNVVSSSNGLVLDRSIRYKNYNFNDGNMKSESLWLRAAAEYRLSNEFTIKNEISYYSADRLWRDADTYSYSAGKITRGITLISHDHEFWSNRTVGNLDANIGGFRNRLAVGTEYLATTFGSTRRFGSTPGVDIFNPDRGVYPEGTTAPFSSRNRESAEHVTKAVFAENAINLTQSWIVSGGIRYESIDLDRNSYNEATGVTTTFGSDLGASSWRVGTSYEVLPGTTVFAQYAKAAMPVSSAMMLASAANTRFRLTTGDTMETGIKSVMFGGRLTTTASVYQIEQDDILTRNPAAPAVVVQGGSQRSRGVEVEAAASLTDRWKVSVAGTLIDTEFTELRDSAGKNLAGNRPVNAVPYAWNALMTYRLDWLPATIGAQVVGVGPFYTSNANRYEAAARTTLDAWVAFNVGKGILRVRGRNLTNEFYAEWADYNETALYVGAPRSFDVTYSVKW